MSPVEFATFMFSVGTFVLVWIGLPEIGKRVDQIAKKLGIEEEE